MLKMIQRNKTKFLVFLVMIGIMSLSITLAMVTDRTGLLTNTFEIGEVETEIQEETGISNGTLTKEPKVYNKGPNDCYVRMRVTISPSQIKEYLEDKNSIDYDTENWQYNKDDGFWYYKTNQDYTKVGAGEMTKPLFTTVKDLIKEDGTIIEKFKDLKGFEITLYQEAVQTVVYQKNDDGSVTTVDNPGEIWNLYDSKN